MRTHFFRSLPAICSLALTVAAGAQMSVTTYHNDIARTGLNPAETTLTTGNVNPNTFGLLFPLQVDGQVYAQPLYLPRVAIPNKGTHNVLYVCTEHDTVYAFDADSNQGANAQPLWQMSLGTSVPNSDTGTDDITQEVGITGTPVIGTVGTSRYLYVVSKTKEPDGSGGYNYFQRLHALDTTNGHEVLGGPVNITAIVNGTGEGNDGHGHIVFNPLIQHNRPALLLLSTGGGSMKLYIGFASHGDNGPYHGWVFVYDAKTLAKVAVWNSTPNALNDPSGYPIAAGGIWQGGGGLASDGSSVYFATGNGTFDPSTKAYGDAIIRLSLANGALGVGDYFAPADQLSLDQGDTDLGSGGVMILPSSVGSGATPNLLVQSGKEGAIYLVNRASMGKFHNNNRIVQEVDGQIGGVWGNPAYWNGLIFYGGSYSNLASLPVSNAQINSAGRITSTEGYGYPGPTPAVSSNGNTNAIVWAVDTAAYGSGGPSLLRAYDATNLATTLYDSTLTNGRDSLGAAVKFVTPTVVNGKVYVGTNGEVDVFGLGHWANTPDVAPTGGTFNGPVTVTVTDSTQNALIYYTTDGSTPTPASKLYTGQVHLTGSADFKARAYLPNNVGGSGVGAQSYLINPVLGKGGGLIGKYYNNSQDPTTGTITATREDPTIDFEWGGNSPIRGVAGSNWAAEWNGYIMAETTGTYKISTISDDGVRVWVADLTNPIIDDWSYHARTTDAGTVSMQAGHNYKIRIRFFQGGGDSLLHLRWSAPGLADQVVPATQLSH